MDLSDKDLTQFTKPGWACQISDTFPPYRLPYSCSALLLLNYLFESTGIPTAAMSDFGALYQRSMFFTPDQQDLLFATLSSPDQLVKPQTETTFDGVPVKTQQSPLQQNGASSHNIFDSPSEPGAPNSGRMSLSDESPFMDFSLYPDFESAGGDSMIGELPGSESREKRKGIDGKEEEESGKKRKENDEKVAKKPGRKPLTSEPTSVCITILSLSLC